MNLPKHKKKKKKLIYNYLKKKKKKKKLIYNYLIKKTLNFYSKI